MEYKFEPNDFARKMFHLAAKSLTGHGLTSLLVEVLGMENFRKYMFAQNPLPGPHVPGRSADVFIILNPEEKDYQNAKFRSIGKVLAL